MNKSVLISVLHILLLLPAISFSQIEPGTFVVRPKEIDVVLNNPGIGFTTFQRFDGDTLTTLNNNKGWTEGPTRLFTRHLKENWPIDNILKLLLLTGGFIGNILSRKKVNIAGI
jgi:hypothetical protein